MVLNPKPILRRHPYCTKFYRQKNGGHVAVLLQCLPYSSFNNRNGPNYVNYIYLYRHISAKKPRNLFLQFTVLTRPMNSCEMKRMRRWCIFISFNSTVLIRGEAYIKFRYLIAPYIWSNLINSLSEVFISTIVGTKY